MYVAKNKIQENIKFYDFFSLSTFPEQSLKSARHRQTISHKKWFISLNGAEWEFPVKGIWDFRYETKGTLVILINNSSHLNSETEDQFDVGWSNIVEKMKLQRHLSHVNVWQANEKCFFQTWETAKNFKLCRHCNDLLYLRPLLTHS